MGEPRGRGLLLALLFLAVLSTAGCLSGMIGAQTAEPLPPGAQENLRRISPV